MCFKRVLSSSLCTCFPIQDEYYSSQVQVARWATNPEVQIGPAVSKAELEKDLDYAEVGKSEGAKIASGGKMANPSQGVDGHFIEPTRGNL